MDFIYGEFDVLISTTIVENGIDIPNANTIIVNNAQNFGLSDLHQLRGRVGRGSQRGYCYLLSPGDELLTPDARRRLRAIEEFSDLGSGFNIAMQDLDIRAPAICWAPSRAALSRHRLRNLPEDHAGGDRRTPLGGTRDARHGRCRAGRGR